MVEIARASGLYGLFNLDGAPVSADDAGILGIKSPHILPSWLIDGHDPQSPATIHRHSDSNGSIVLAGRVADTPALAARLGLAKVAPLAQIAEAALAQFGPETPAEMLGEWSLIRRAGNGRLTLMVGPAMRDRLHYAIVGSKLAVASDMFRLAKIVWIGKDEDEAGMLFRWGRANIRQHHDGRTMLSRVKRIDAGESVVIDPDGRLVKSRCDAMTPQKRWVGSFDDAVAESEGLLRKIMREQIVGTVRPAIMLSGGLDSSLLAWLASEERSHDQNVLSITSAAPPGSGIPDEVMFAQQVAHHIGISCTAASASNDADFFRPPDSILSGASGPILSNRHCLTEALQIAAKAAGAGLMIDGTFGEMTATAHLPLTGIFTRLRASAVRAYHGIRGIRGIDDRQALDYPFHVHLSPQALGKLPDPITAAIGQHHDDRWPEPKRGDLLGYLPGAEKALVQPNEFYPGALRMELPFRDLRLYRLFAGFPVEMLLTGGHDRPVVRAMMKGHIPDAIRLRRRGMPAEPDRYFRMQRQAGAARQRIPAFRKADIDEWIDLDWLDAALLRVAEQGAADNNDSNEVQLTAIAAEFLLWWRTRF